MTKAQAQVELAAIIDPINAKESGANPECALKDFVSVFFFPFYRRKWIRSTAMTTEDRIMRHIVGHFGKRAVGSFTRDELQDFLEEKAKGEFSMSILSNLRWDLKQIFDMAVAEGHISKNPAALLFTPRSQKQSAKNIMNLKEVNQCFDVLELRERLVVKFATLAGMRPGEILGLKWGAVKTDHCDISMRIYRGDIDRPKTSHSVRKAALSESLLSDLDE
jgi:site-specific recombinase XerD